jgi:Na/Pi-cotransporter II-like protein
MVVGFVNAGFMNIYPAVGIIMVANIGTTITGQLVELNIPQLASIIAFIGFTLNAFFKKEKNFPGRTIMGSRLLIYKHRIYEQDHGSFKRLSKIYNFDDQIQNPILGVLAGAIIKPLSYVIICFFGYIISFIYHSNHLYI